MPSFDDKDFMPAITVQITRFVDDHFPGCVECNFVDALGETHVFIEKVPMVSIENLSSTSDYPRSGSIDCRIEEEWNETTGRAVARVDTTEPWDMESTRGMTSFVVLASQLEGNR